MFVSDKTMRILRVIANFSSQTIPCDQIFLEAKRTSDMDAEQVEESLKILELNGLVGKRGDLYYTTTKGSIIARKGIAL